MSDHWTHHDPAVRELIRQAEARVWDEAHRVMCDDMSNWGECLLNAGYRHGNPYEEGTA